MYYGLQICYLLRDMEIGDFNKDVLLLYMMVGFY